jgi:hypothetical protein
MQLNNLVPWVERTIGILGLVDVANIYDFASHPFL